MLDIKVIASGSSGNCYAVSDGKSTLLLDAGIPYKKIQIAMNFKMNSISGALITHRHGDHCKAVPDLVKAGINIYAPEDVFKALNLLDGYCKYRCNVMYNGISDDGLITSRAIIGTFEVVAFNGQHDVPILGFYIKSRNTGDSLLYFTDTYYIKPKFKGLNYIMAECNYSAEIVNRNVCNGIIPVAMKTRLMTAHMSIDTLEKMLCEYDLTECRKIYLLHMSNNNGNEEEFKRRIQAISGCQVYVC